MKRVALLAATILTAGCAQTPVAPRSETAAVAMSQPSPSVRESQEQLRTLGFYSGAIDGVRGPETSSAIESFQRSRGLADTGQLDPATLRALRAEAAPPSVAVPLTDSAQVREVQSRLRTLGFYRGPIDGAWGPETRTALERFQSVRGLDVTGRPTDATIVALGLRPGAPSVNAGTVAEPLDPAVIRTVQWRLRRLGFYSGGADGVWGARSSEAVERFQRNRGLQPTGDLNPTTLAALGLDPNNLSGDIGPWKAGYGSGSSLPR
jgi:peptidoglycan hydrolase-like protein with peptidoglycan-binding domain